MKKLITIGLVLLLTACNNHPHHQKIQSYRTHSGSSGGVNSDAWIYYYILWNAANTQCYYYSSPYPVSNYSNVSWQSSTTSPIQNMDEAESMGTQVVENEDLSTEMQQEIDTNPENFEGMTQDDMGDYESDGGGDGSVSTSSDDGESGSDNGSSGDSGGDSGGDGGGGE